MAPRGNTKLLDKVKSISFYLLALYIFLLQWQLYWMLDIVSTGGIIRSIFNSLAFLFFLKLVEGRFTLKVIVGVVVFIIALIQSLLIVHIKYFYNVPSEINFTLLSQGMTVFFHALSLIDVTQYAELVGLLCCIVFYISNSESPLEKKNMVRFFCLSVLFFIIPYVILIFDIWMGGDYFSRRFHFSRHYAVKKLGYLNYLIYRKYQLKGKSDYSESLQNPIPIRRKFVSSSNKEYNFIIIQVESLDGSLMGKKVNGIPVIPVIGQLAKTGVYFPNFFAQHSLGGSSDAEIAAITGLLPLADTSTVIDKELHHLPSVVKQLKAVGYKTYAFHGNTGTFWNRKSAYKQLGFDAFFDEKYYEGNACGFYSDDGEFFKQTLPKIEKIAQQGKFFAYIITQSMHGPYMRSYVTQYNKRITSRNSTVQHYFRMANYTDMNLGIFLNNLRRKGILKNTVLIIWGDHTSEIISSEYDCGKNIRENVPCIIITPERKRGMNYTYGSHIDMAPTILDLAGMEPDRRMFGRSLMRWFPGRLFPIIVNIRPWILYPGRNCYASDSLNPDYLDTYMYSRSYFYRLDYKYITSENPLINYRYIAHALGAIDNIDYTNSIESYMRSYNLGVRVMEADFCFVKNGELVCFHEGHEQKIGLEEGEKIGSIDLKDFNNRKLLKTYSVIDLKKLLQLMKNYPDVYIVTDFKESFDASLNSLTKKTETIDSELFKRFIIQIYNPADLVAVKRVKQFNNVVFTLYKSNMDNDEVLNFVKENTSIIKAVTVSKKRFDSSLASRLKEIEVPLFVHTVNSIREMNAYVAHGAYGFYTDLKSEMVK